MVMNAIQQAAALMQRLRGELSVGNVGAKNTIAAAQANIKSYEEVFAAIHSAAIHSADVIVCPAPVFTPPEPPSYDGFSDGDEDEDEEADEEDEDDDD